MNKITAFFFSCFLLFCTSVSINAQINTVIEAEKDSLVQIQDSIGLLREKIAELERSKSELQVRIDELSQDTTTNKYRMRRRAGRIIGSMFGESAQLSNADSLIRRFDNTPSFGMYKDNYFIVGTELFGKKNKWNSDAKFQVSIRQRLTNSILPFKTHIYFTYTQKAFWDVFQESLPFRDLNFNPAIGIGRPLIFRNRFLGLLTLDFEHESNGKDGDASRSWNKITFGSLFVFRDRWIWQSKIWIPLIDGGENKDITSYSGFAMTALTYSSLKRKYNVSCVLTKRAGNILNHNVQLNFSVRLFSNEDLYLFAEYYDGYGESMLSYKDYRQRIRFGILMKSGMFSFF